MTGSGVVTGAGVVTAAGLVEVPGVVDVPGGSSAPASVGPSRAVRYVDHVMSMPISLALRGRHAGDVRARSAWAAVVAELRRVDRMFSTYRSDSYISRLDRGEISLDGCPPEVAEVLSLGAAAEQQSHGAFRVRRTGPDGRDRLDPAGVVKGWAVDRAAAHLRSLPDTDFCLSAGGDLVCRTLDAVASPWRIGVEDPHDTTHLVAVLPLRTGAVATSGAAHRGAHVVDGRTGAPPRGVGSVTVIAATLTWADIDATAAYAQGPDADRWLGTRRGRAGLIVWDDGATTLVGAATPAGGSATGRTATTPVRQPVRSSMPSGPFGPGGNRFARQGS